MVELLPLISIIGFGFFYKKNNLNHFLVSLIFLSFYMFATNYNYIFGLEFDFYRYLHRSIGIILAISLIFYILRNKVNFLKEPGILILIYFFIVIFFSFFNNDLQFEYYYHYSRNFIFISLIISFIYFNVDSNDKLDELFKVFLYLSVFLSFCIIYELIKVNPMALSPETWSAKWGRRVSLFYSNPNYLAFALLPGFVVAIFSSNKYKVLTLLPILVAIFGTGSRSVELAVVTIIMIYLFSKKFNKIYFFTSLTSLFLIIYLALFSSLSFFDRIVTNHNIDKSRLAFAKITLNIIKEEPLNGIGYGQFRVKYIKYLDQDIIDMRVSELTSAQHSHNEDLTDNQLESFGVKRYMEIMTHNDLLTIIAELGLLGVIFLCYLVYKLYFEYRDLFLRKTYYFYVSLSMTSGALIYSLFHNNITSFIFWFILILPFIINRNYSR